MPPDPQQVQQMFAAITPRYDLLNTVLSLGFDRRWRGRVVELSGLQEGGSATDICCGTGELAQLLGQRVGAAGSVVGVDFCEDMLIRARQKFPSIQFVAGDALGLPLADQTFDAATMAFGLRNLADVRRGLAEMRRVLRPRGKALVLELTRPQGALRALYFPYLCGLLPVVGGLISRRADAYSYLARTIREFLTTQQICDEMTAVGLQQVQAHPLMGGIATIFVGSV